MAPYRITLNLALLCSALCLDGKQILLLLLHPYPPSPHFLHPRSLLPYPSPPYCADVQKSVDVVFCTEGMNRLEQKKATSKKLKEKQKKKELKEQALRALAATPQEDPIVAAIRREAARQRAADEGDSDSDSEANRRRRRRAAGKAKAKGTGEGKGNAFGSDSFDDDDGDGDGDGGSDSDDPRRRDRYGDGGSDGGSPGGWGSPTAKGGDDDDDYDYFAETDIRPHLPLVTPRAACEPLFLHVPKPYKLLGGEGQS